MATSPGASTFVDLTTNSVAFPKVWPDLQVEFQMLLEHAHMHYPWVRFLKLNRESTTYNEVYGDAEEPELRYDEPVNLRMGAQWKPDEQMLTRYGIDQNQEIIFVIPTPELIRVGLLTVNQDDKDEMGPVTVTMTNVIGSRLLYGHQRYHVNGYNSGPFWGMSLIPLDYVFTVEKAQRASFNLQA